MDIIADIFSDIILTKVDEKEGYTIFASRIASRLAGGYQRYVLVFAQGYGYNKHINIRDVVWQNLQTRHLLNSYRLRPQHLNIISHRVNDVLLHVVRRTPKHTEYRAPSFPYEVLLLHDPKKKTVYQYSNKIYLSAALDTFQCIVNRINTVPTMNTQQEENDYQLIESGYD